MKETNVYTKIITDENLMETIPHGSQDYPFRYYYEHLAQFDFNCIDWHWHTELEFVYVQSGTVTVWIGEKQLELPTDSGIFINSKFLHRFSSPVDAIIPNFLCMGEQKSSLFQPIVYEIIDRRDMKIAPKKI